MKRLSVLALSPPLHKTRYLEVFKALIPLQGKVEAEEWLFFQENLYQGLS